MHQRIQAVLLSLTLILLTTTALAHPVIITQPSSTSACLGTPASFTVAATSAETPTYQWYYNDVTLIAGATDATYTISTVAGGDAGSYKVIVTDSGGPTTSDSVTLTVNNATAAVGPSSQTANQGAAATFTTVAGGTGPFTYTWRKDGT